MCVLLECEEHVSLCDSADLRSLYVPQRKQIHAYNL